MIRSHTRGTTPRTPYKYYGYNPSDLPPTPHYRYNPFDLIQYYGYNPANPILSLLPILWVQAYNPSDPIHYILYYGYI